MLVEIVVEIAAILEWVAKTSSLSAGDMKHFKRKGEGWVRF
ncbi:putative ATP-dependent zinc protease [Pseudomonas syringae group genomosp. 7]